MGLLATMTSRSYGTGTVPLSSGGSAREQHRWGRRSQTMQYRVRFVEDDDLPGASWAIVPKTTDGLGPFLFVRESAVSADLLSECWEAWQQHFARLPEQRRSVG